MKHKHITGIVLLFVLTLAALVWNRSPNPSIFYADVYGEDGVWDLREFDFSSGSATLRGAVRYIPDALPTPEECA